MIIIDCPDYVRFPSNIYHHISTNKSHTVRPIGDQPQFHLIVIQMPNTPTDDVDIKQLWLKNRRGETVPDSFWEWYGGAQVFNVFLKDHMLRRQLSILADMLVDSMVHRKMIQRGANIPSEGNITGFGQVWVTGQGVWRVHRNARNWVNNTGKANLREDAEVAAEIWIAVPILCDGSNVQVLEKLFPDMVKAWRLNTLGRASTRTGKAGCAAPSGFHGCAVTAFATMCYVAGLHFDRSDLSFTVGMRAFRAEHEPPEAYQFVYPSLRLVGSPLDHCGIIMSQPTGSITLWPAWRIVHGSSIDIRKRDEIPYNEGQSLALLQKRSMFTFCENSQLPSVIDFKAMGDYYDRSLNR